MPLCECGCGEMCRNRFVQGHNAKRGVGGSLRSRILQKITIFKPRLIFGSVGFFVVGADG